MKDYDGYNYQRFKELAQDNTISMYAKIGSPDSYREHCEDKIFEDILSKLPLLRERERVKGA